MKSKRPDMTPRQDANPQTKIAAVGMPNLNAMIAKIDDRMFLFL
jgi:hypothetical protein